MHLKLKMSDTASDEEFQPVTQYHSEDSELNDDEQAQATTSTRTVYTWRRLRSFENAAEAKEWIKTQNLSRISRYDTNIGIKEQYRCNKVPFRGIQCSYAFYLLYHDDSMEVTAFESEQAHKL